MDLYYFSNGKVQSIESKESASLYGSLCVSHDCLNPRMPMPKDLKRGDWLIFPDCGAYGVTASAPFFIGQSLPNEWACVDSQANSLSIKNVFPENFKSYHQATQLG